MATIRQSLTEADVHTGRRSSSPGDRQGNGRSLAVHFSSCTDEWPTPDWLFQLLDREFRFTLDPCSTPANARCTRHFTRAEDGLAQSWAGETVFMNPPYGREIRHWMRKAFESARAGATVVCLVPARTDTAWWHAHVIHGEIRFLRGRLKFGQAKQGAPFPSAIVVFRPSDGNNGCEATPLREGRGLRMSGKPWCIARCFAA